MSSNTLILVTLFLLSAFAIRSQTIPSVHSILVMNGLPAGLLPDAAGKYRLDTNGELEVKVPADICIVYLPSSILRYEETVSGKISFAKLEDVKGILLLQAFGWVPVTGIERVETTINLHLGLPEQTVVSRPAVEFREVPSCAAPKPPALKDSLFLDLFSGVANSID